MKKIALDLIILIGLIIIITFISAFFLVIFEYSPSVKEGVAKPEMMLISLYVTFTALMIKNKFFEE